MYQLQMQGVSWYWECSFLENHLNVEFQEQCDNITLKQLVKTKQSNLITQALNVQEFNPNVV